ncbi:MAG: orotidine 5'-phosphate decarboxylase [Thermodesulfovibrionales bacterium]|nr:orotidine 5'-phosphate decarboxylase [Thermodesulfovibrionales bacterium]
MPLLQLAIDLVSPKKALEIARSAEKYFDILEAGTPLIKSSGIEIVKRLKEEFPKKIIFADLKIMDAGALEASIAFDAGADMISVCGQASIETVREAISETRRRSKKVIVDLIGAKDMIKLAGELKYLMPDFFCIHTGLDEQRKGRRPSEFLDEYARLINYPYSIAGGIKPDDIKDLIRFRPDIIVVGGYVTKAENPLEAAKNLRDALSGG